MSYKVLYHTFAIMPDGSIGNVVQNLDHVFTDIEISKIPAALDKYLLPKNKVAEIDKIENVGGKVLPQLNKQPIPPEQK